jgi:hypothetical protein
MTRLSLRAVALAAPALALLPSEAAAHGFAGDRFFRRFCSTIVLTLLSCALPGIGPLVDLSPHQAWDLRSAWLGTDHKGDLR